MVLAKQTPFTGASFSLNNRIARSVWQFVYIVLFRPSPPPLHRWRCWLLRCFGARIGSPCFVYNSVQIWAPWNLIMADHSTLAPRVICYSMAPISLGKRVVISQGVHLCTGSHDFESENFQLFAKPITVAQDAWICADAFVAPGVSIEAGAVIGARSVVTRNQPSWMVCAGNPCRPIKRRRPPSYSKA